MDAGERDAPMYIALDLPDLAWRAAEEVVHTAQEAIAIREVFHLALSGGFTPLPLFALLAMPEWAARVDWARTHVYWADERCVPPDSPQSNYRAAYDALLERVPVPPGHVHRIRGEINPHEAAAEYERVLSTVTLDLVLLGLGDDGHTASLFPGTAAIHETEQRVAAQRIAKLDAWRITLTPAALNTAGKVVFMASGAEKAAVVRDVLRGPFQPDTLPAQVIHPESGQLLWLIDRAAAGML